MNLLCHRIIKILGFFVILIIFHPLCVLAGESQQLANEVTTYNDTLSQLQDAFNNPDPVFIADIFLNLEEQERVLSDHFDHAVRRITAAYQLPDKLINSSSSLTEATFAVSDASQSRAMLQELVFLWFGESEPDSEIIRQYVMDEIPVTRQLNLTALESLRQMLDEIENISLPPFLIIDSAEEIESSAGTTVQLPIKVQNIGNDTAKNVELIVSIIDSANSQSQRVLLGDIPGGVSISHTLNIGIGSSATVITVMVTSRALNGLGNTQLITINVN